MLNKKERQEVRTVVLSGAQHANQQIAREMEELRKNPLDRAPRAGGFYIGEDGEPHDADGRKLKGEGEKAKALDAEGKPIEDGGVPEGGALSLVEQRMREAGPGELGRRGAGAPEPDSAAGQPAAKTGAKSAPKRPARKRG